MTWRPARGRGLAAAAGYLLLYAACLAALWRFEGRSPAGHAVVRAFFDERAFTLDDAALVERARRELAGLLGIAPGARPFSRVVRWPNAMPHYHVGHLERVAALRARTERWPGLILAGNSYTGVGLPDCIVAGEEAAESLSAIPRTVPHGG